MKGRSIVGRWRGRAFVLERGWRGSGVSLACSGSFVVLVCLESWWRLSVVVVFGLKEM